MDFGKSLCVLCRRALAQATLVASPSDCPTHYFHFDCLAQHASQDRRCPIDRVPFDNIVCDDGGGAAAAPEQDEGKIKADIEKEEEKEKEDADSEKTNEEQVNINVLPPLAGMKISCEENNKSDSKETICQSAGKKIVISNEPIGGGGGGGGRDGRGLRGIGGLLEGNSPTIVDCDICKRNSPGEIASPDCCVHWFHRSCLENYLRSKSVCPVRGCHKEVSTYITSSGEGRGIRMTVECEYRNMASAPDGFECGVCHQAELGQHRAVAKPCGHMFHRQCITDFVRSHKKCPTCETPTTLVTGCTSGDLSAMHFD